jgi:hypothetical protein
VDWVEQIVEQAITYTLTVLRRAPANLDLAHAALERMSAHLVLDFPGHPALERLQAFLRELEIIAGERSLH